MRLSRFDEPTPAYELSRARAAWEHSHCEFNRQRLQRAIFAVLCISARLQCAHAWEFRRAPASPLK